MGTEALFPTLYPELMNSTDFKTSLFPVMVTIEGDKAKGEKDQIMSYYDYLESGQKKSWWIAAISNTLKWFIRLFIEEKERDNKIDPFRLTKKQSQIQPSRKEPQQLICDYLVVL